MGGERLAAGQVEVAGEAGDPAEDSTGARSRSLRSRAQASTRSSTSSRMRQSSRQVKNLDIKIVARETGAMHSWDPDRYLTYADERGRPFVELLARVGATSPGASSTSAAAGQPDRAAGAALARRHGHRGRLQPRDDRRGAGGHGDAGTFEVADLRTGRRPTGVDVLVSNATLQWLPDHLDLLPGLVRQVRPGGWLAFQVPGNFGEPSHTIRAELAAEPAYAAYTREVAVPASHDPGTYLRALAALGCAVDAWETTYLHVLTGEDPVFTWVSGTGARPTLQALPAGLRAEFEAEFRARLRAAYPTAGTAWCCRSAGSSRWPGSRGRPMRLTTSRSRCPPAPRTTPGGSTATGSG